MMTKEKPNIVFKYHKINQYFQDLLTNGQLWFSHQNELNDPFDCKYALTDTYLISILKNSSGKLLSDLQERVPESAVNRDVRGPRFNATVIAICPGVLRSERLEMIPYWIELNPADLIQGTVVMSLAVYFFIFTLTSSVRRA